MIIYVYVNVNRLVKKIFESEKIFRGGAHLRRTFRAEAAHINRQAKKIKRRRAHKKCAAAFIPCNMADSISFLLRQICRLCLQARRLLR